MAKPPQLFDDPTVSEPERSKHWKRKGENATPSPIGSGPPSETCRSCKFAQRLNYHDKVYHKCKLMEKYWTHGGATDIKLKWEACKSWEPNHFRIRVLTLPGDFSIDMIEACGWFREPLLIIAEHYEELGMDMGWLRFAALKVPCVPHEPGG